MIIDTDTHVTEPPDVWVDRMSRQRWGDLVPHVKFDPSNRMDMWYVGDQPVRPASTSSFMVPDPLTGGPRRWDKPYPEVPPTLDAIHPSSYDAKARLDVMDQAGIWAAALFPNLNFVGANMFAMVEDADFQLDCIKAYNDWLIDWVQADARRFIPLACIPYWDVKAAVKEIYRAAEIGHKGLVTTGAPHKRNQPFLADRHWDPVWAAAEETGLPICFHAGGGDVSGHLNDERAKVEGSAAMVARATTAILLDNGVQLTDLLLSGVLPRFPLLKFVSVESGMGFIPFCLDSADYHFKQVRVDQQKPEFTMLPSDYYRRQVYATFWFERIEDHHLERLGSHTLLFETDYPHSTCLAPEDVQAGADFALAHVTDDEVKDRIRWKNAAKLFKIQAPPNDRR